MNRPRPGVCALVVCALIVLAGCAPVSHVGPSPTPSSTTRPKSTTKPGAPPARVGIDKPISMVTQHGHGPAGSAMVTGNRTVALTFDDGPDPVNTPKVLDLLKAQHVHATFCLVGTNVRKNPSLVRRIVAEGHTICDHTWNHSLTIGKQTDAVILADLRATNAAIHAAAPNAKIKYFRAPGGNFTTRLVKDAASLGMKSIYWAVDPRDWDFPHYGHGQSMVNHIISAVERGVRPGSIVLSHDYRKPDTLAAYRVLLPWLKKFFTLVALP